MKKHPRARRLSKNREAKCIPKTRCDFPGAQLVVIRSVIVETRRTTLISLLDRSCRPSFPVKGCAHLQVGCSSLRKMVRITSLATFTEHALAGTNATPNNCAFGKGPSVYYWHRYSSKRKGEANLLREGNRLSILVGRRRQRVRGLISCLASLSAVIHAVPETLWYWGTGKRPVCGVKYQSFCERCCFTVLQSLQ
jgi:hypothetical protein